MTITITEKVRALCAPGRLVQAQPLSFRIVRFDVEVRFRNRLCKLSCLSRVTCHKAAGRIPAYSRHRPPWPEQDAPERAGDPAKRVACREKPSALDAHVPNSSKPDRRVASFVGEHRRELAAASPRVDRPARRGRGGASSESGDSAAQVTWGGGSSLFVTPASLSH